MLVQIKQQNNLTTSPLNGDNNLKFLSITRNGHKHLFDISLDEIKIELYPFETISNVLAEVVNTSKVEQNTITPTTGTFTVTSEDGMQKSYPYNIEEISYVNGLPIVTNVTSNGLECSIISEPKMTQISNMNFNLGVIAKRDSNIIDLVTLADGGWVLLDAKIDFDSIEQIHLYNGSDKYIKTWRSSDSGSTNYDKFVYYKIVENSSLFESNPIVTPVKLPYENNIGYYNFDVFIPLKDNLNIEEIYNKSNKLDLENYLNTNTIEFYNVSFSEIDLSFSNEIIEKNILWNKHFDKGFKQEDVLKMSKTFAKKVLSIIDGIYEPIWNQYKVGKVYESLEDEINDKKKNRLSYLKLNKMEYIFEWFEYIDREIISDVYESTKDFPSEIKIIKENFSKQFTYQWMIKHFNENDAIFFKNRFEYMYDIYKNYKSDLSLSELIMIRNIFITLENVIISNKVSRNIGTVSFDISIKSLVEKSNAMYLFNPFN